MALRFVFFLYFIQLVVSLQAQISIEPERISIEDGLSQGFISALLQDSDGFIWTGTKNGLNRYDGEQFEIFTNDPADPYSLSHDWINSLFEVGDYILVGTIGGGLNIYHKKTKKFHKIPATNPNLKFWSTMGIVKILLDDLGQIWLLEETSGKVIRLRLPDKFWQRLPIDENVLLDVEIKEIPDLSLAHIYEGDDKHIWGVIYPNKLLKIEIASGDWKLIENQYNSEGDLYFAAQLEDGLLTFHFGEQSILLFKNKIWQTINSDFTITNLFYFQEDKQLWISSRAELLLFDQWTPDQKIIKREDAMMIMSTSRDTYNHLIKDKSGVIWVGTGGYGIIKINPRLFKIKKYFEGASVSAPPFMIKQGQIVVSDAESDGLLNNSLFSFPKNILKRIWWFTGEDNSTWMVGKEQDQVAVYQMDEFGQIKKRTTLYSDSGYEHYTVYKEPEAETIWVASPTGKLIRYIPSLEEIKSFDFNHLFYSSFNCYSLTKTTNGHIWIGTSRGLLHGVPTEEAYNFELIEANDSEVKGLLNNDVSSLLPDPRDNQILWLGTKGGGLHRLDTRSMIFSHLTSKNGLPNDVIYGILADDDNNLWLSSNRGIIKYNHATGSIRNFTKADGMQSDEFNTWAYAKSSAGELMFGGINGLNVFHPDDLKENQELPEIWITSLIVNNEAVKLGDGSGLLQNAIEYTSHIILPFSKNSITLEFAALEFSVPLKNRFRYYLQGVEEEWIHENTENKAAYLSLSPGNYTFRVKASNGDGVWNEQPTELKITILPPWYLSQVAYLLYAIIFGLVVWQFLKFQKKRLEQKHTLEFEQKEKQRLKELDQAKSRLYTNITHEFRTPLTVISGIVEQMKGDNEGKLLIKRNSDQLLNLVNQMLDLRKLESGVVSINKKQSDIIKYLRYLTESLISYAEMKGLTIHFLSDEQSLMMDFDKEKITRIHSNLLSNAIKFTNEGGDIYVQLNIEKKEDHSLLIMKIRDTGIGIPNEKLPYVFERFYQVDASTTRKGEGTGIGLTLVAELIKAMDGEINVKSEVGQGTTFMIMLPITNIAQLSDIQIDGKESSISMVDTVIPKLTILDKESELKAKKSSKPVVLIVEDNADVIHYLITSLKEDFELEVAMDGEEGIEKAISKTPDIIVSDVMMPIKDGFELCQTLKTDERTSHIPIILLTAKADIESRLEGLQKGADAYLNKPFHQQELLIILQNQLALRKKLQKRFLQFSKPTSASGLDDVMENNAIEIQLEVEDAFLQKIRKIIESNLSDSNIGMPQLMRKLGMSRSQIYKKTKALTGRSPSLYIRSIRLHHAQVLLKTTDLNVSEVAYEIGFSSPFYFSDVYYEEFGVRPNETRK